MEKRLKETALIDYKHMIRKSWAYARLTQKEKENWENMLESIQTRNALKGSWQNRWDILQALYTSYLSALDYKPIGWREEQKDIPLF